MTCLSPHAYGQQSEILGTEVSVAEAQSGAAVVSQSESQLALTAESRVRGTFGSWGLSGLGEGTCYSEAGHGPDSGPGLSSLDYLK